MKIPPHFNGALFSAKTGLCDDSWHILADGTLVAPITISDELLRQCVTDMVAVKVRSMQSAIERSYMELAKSLDYDSPERMCCYIGCSIPQWDADGRAMRDHMAATAIAAYNIMAQVQSGQIPEPTETEFMAMLPKFQRPQV